MYPKTKEEAEKHQEISEFIMQNDADYSLDSFEYLCDNTIEFEGLKIHGSPWSPHFCGVNSKCTAFMLPDEHLAEKFSLIPDDLDILLTHTPPYSILDKNIYGERCGSKSLLKVLEEKAKPKHHFFGHINEQHGKVISKWQSYFYNVSYVNERYKPCSPIGVRIIL